MLLRNTDDIEEATSPDNFAAAQTLDSELPEVNESNPRQSYGQATATHRQRSDQLVHPYEDSVRLALNNEVLLPLSGQRTHSLYRAFEILVASLALILAIPVLFVIGVIIKAGTRGPALFRQQRMGVNCKTFGFIKFRTMYHDARKRFPELYAYDYDPEQLESLKFKIEDDPRVTPQGRWLRKSTLDELPNFWNVITGDMALVGPRPEIPEMLPYYTGDMLNKFTVRPGITGLAQISGRGRLGFYETVDLDLQYVRNKSFWSDMRILAKTLAKIILRDGAF